MMKKHLPNLLTLINALAGVVAIINLWEGSLKVVFMCIAISYLADYLDGFLARILDAKSDLGLQLDSLADAVSFGVLPGCIWYYLCRQATVGSVETMVCWVVLIYTGAAIYRLGRFNLDTEQVYHFKGLPTPGAAIAVFTLLWAHYKEIDWMLPLIGNLALLLVLVGVLSLLMNVPWRMLSFKWVDFGWKGNQPRWILIFFTALSIAFFGAGGILLSLGVYLVLSLLMHAELIPWKHQV